MAGSCADVVRNPRDVTRPRIVICQYSHDRTLMTQTLPTAAPVKVAPKLGLVVAALGVVYVVWGSTYLGIRIVVEEAPPLQSMGLRYTCAALVLGAILAMRGGVRRLRVTRPELMGAAFLGLMLPVLGNGMVSVGEDLGAPSGITALLIAV